MLRPDSFVLRLLQVHLSLVILLIIKHSQEVALSLYGSTESSVRACFSYCLLFSFLVILQSDSLLLSLPLPILEYHCDIMSLLFELLTDGQDLQVFALFPILCLPLRLFLLEDIVTEGSLNALFVLALDIFYSWWA